MKILIKVWNNIDKWSVQLCFAFVMVILFTQTCLRYLFHASLSWPEDISAMLMVWIVYLSGSYATTTNSHLRIDFVMMLYPKCLQKFVNVISDVLWLGTTLVVAYYGILYTMTQSNMGSKAISLTWVPLWPIYAAIPLSHILISTKLLYNICKEIKSIIRGDGKESTTPQISGEEDVAK